MHRALRFFKHREQIGWQQLQRVPFHFLEKLADLSAGGAVDARVSHVLFPIRQVSVLSRQAFEGPPLDHALFCAYLTADSTLPLWRGVTGFVGKMTVP